MRLIHVRAHGTARVHRLLLVTLGLAVSVDALALPAKGYGASCRRATGLAIGVVNAPGTWERLGKNPMYFDWSPVLGLACAADLAPISISLGVDSQFMYDHYVRSGDLSQRPWLTANLAVTAGNDEWRVGPHLTGSILPVGMGVTGDWLPGNPHGGRDGLEARLSWYWVEQPNFQFMLLYVVTTGRRPG